MAQKRGDRDHGDEDEQEVCKVCGDKPIGFNFGVVSCDSCRSFFRRCNGAEKTLKCPFQENCHINKESRRCCQACRLQKCYTVGMFYEENSRKRPYKKSSVKTSVALKSPKKSPIQPVEMPVSPPKQCVCRCQCGFYSAETKLVATSNSLEGVLGNFDEFQTSSSYPSISAGTSMDVNSHQMYSGSQGKDLRLDNLNLATAQPGTSYSTSSSSHLPLETYRSLELPKNQLDVKYEQVNVQNPLLNLPHNYSSVIQNSQYLTNLPQIYANTWPYQGNGELPAALSQLSPALPTTSLLNIMQSETSTTFVNLDFENRSLLDELIDANSLLKAPMELSIQELENPHELSLMTVVKISDLAMRRIIAMVKKLSAFRDIEHADQIALLKGGLSELLILRGVMVFDPQKNAWIHHIHSGSQEISLRVDVLKKTPEEAHYQAHMQFLNAFDEKWRKNEPIMLMLNAIILFSSERSNLRNPYAVDQARRRYLNLLKSYLNNICANEMESKEAYGQLNRKLDELRELNRSLQRIYSRLNPDDLEPLLKELFATTT